MCSAVLPGTQQHVRASPITGAPHLVAFIPQIIASHTGRRDQPYLGFVVAATFLQNLSGYTEIRVDSLNYYFSLLNSPLISLLVTLW